MIKDIIEKVKINFLKGKSLFTSSQANEPPIKIVRKVVVVAVTKVFKKAIQVERC